MERKSFIVTDLKTKKFFVYTPLTPDSWTLNGHPKDGIGMRTNEQVQKDFEYFSSLWMDYDVETITS